MTYSNEEEEEGYYNPCRGDGEGRAALVAVPLMRRVRQSIEEDGGEDGVTLGCGHRTSHQAVRRQDKEKAAQYGGWRGDVGSDEGGEDKE